MATYRRTRNFVASIIDYLQTQINSSWSGITVCRGFEEAYGLPLPVVAVRCESSVTNHGELGDNAEVRDYAIYLDIFATDGGMREDLKDFIMDNMKVGCPYYDYVTGKTPNGRNTTVQSKTADGRIRVMKMTDTVVKFDIDKDKVVLHDRHRHLVVCTVNRSKLE
jgi:hypothetical protein